MDRFKALFTSKLKLLERIESLEIYVGASYKTTGRGGWKYSSHEPNRDKYSNNPIANLIIKEEDKK